MNKVAEEVVAALLDSEQGPRDTGPAPGASPKPLRVVCAWCEPNVKDDNVTHGICKRHLVQQKLAAVKANLNRRQST